MEAALEFGSVIGLDRVDGEGQFRGDVVHELDRGFLVQGSIYLQHPLPGAVVDGGELVVVRAPA